MQPTRLTRASVAAVLAVLVGAPVLGASSPPPTPSPSELAAVQIVTHQLADNVYYLEGAGGNVAPQRHHPDGHHHAEAPGTG